MTEVFQGKYGFSKGSVGLSFLGIGIGQFFGLVWYGRFSDKMLKRLAAKNGGEMKPEGKLTRLHTAVLVFLRANIHDASLHPTMLTSW